MIRTLTYPENSTDEMLRESGFGDSRPIVEDDRDLLTSGLLGKEVISFCAVVNSDDKGTVALVSCCCLLWRWDRKAGSDCLRS